MECSRAENFNTALVNDLLEAVEVSAITDSTGAPVMMPDSAGNMVGSFYLDGASAATKFQKIKGEAAAAGVDRSFELRKVPLAEVYLPLIAQGDKTQLGGELRIEPIPREVRNAKQILSDPRDLGPPGTVPLFLAPTLELASRDFSFTPAYIREADLRQALKKAGGSGARVEVTTLQSLVARVSEPQPEKNTLSRIRVIPPSPS